MAVLSEGRGSLGALGHGAPRPREHGVWNLLYLGVEKWVKRQRTDQCKIRSLTFIV